MKLLATPVKRLDMDSNQNAAIYAKFEQDGATHSIKDRMISYVLDKSVENGKLRPTQAIVEASSGNTGAALAYEGQRRGQKVTIFVSSSIGIEKVALIEEFGATVVKVDTSNMPGGEIEQAKQFAKTTGAFYFNQFENPYHVDAYQEVLAKETSEQLNENSIKVDTLVAAVGTGATLIALAKELRKSHNPDLKVFAVFPSNYPTDIEGIHPGHLVPQGHFKIWLDRPSAFETGTIFVDDRDAYLGRAQLATDYKIEAGPASGAAFHAAKLLSDMGNRLFLVTDHARKYTEKIAKWRIK